MRRQGRGRGLGIGLGISIALHAFMGLWLVRERGPAPEAPVGGGREVELIEVQVVPTGGREVSPAPGGGGPAQSSALSALASEAPVPSRSPAPPEATPPSPGTAAPGSVAVVPEPGLSTAGGGSGGTAPGPSSPTGGSGAAAPGPGSSAGGGSGVPPSTNLLMARLSAAALRCYPAEAVRFHLSGEARLSFCLGDDGRASAVAVARSSGSEVLDRAASDCVLPGALPLPGAAGCYELPVRFAARGR